MFAYVQKNTGCNCYYANWDSGNSAHTTVNYSPQVIWIPHSLCWRFNLQNLVRFKVSQISQKTDLIIIDEIVCMTRWFIECLDRFLKELMGNDKVM